MIDNTQDVIDSRDVIERMEELTAEEESLIAALEEAENYDAEATGWELFEWGERYGDELDVLKTLNNDGSNFPDWDSGAILINESYFEEYCNGLEVVAEEIKQDYGTVEFGGQTFYIRS